MIYHNQRLKPSVPGVPNWAQCFYCSVVMLIEHYVGGDLYAKYFDDVEVLYGQKGIGEESMKRHNLSLVAKNGSRVRSGQFWAVHCDAANKYLAPKKAVWSEITWDAFRARLLKGPCVLGTKIPPSDGHIIVVLGYDGQNYICNDPYGNGKTGYKDANGGELVKYDGRWLESVSAVPGKARAMWVEG